MLVLTIALAVIFGALSSVHVYWAVRGPRAGSGAVPSHPDGTPLFAPRAGSTLAVAAALATAAVVVLGRGGAMAPIGPHFIYAMGAWVLGGVLLLRAIGDFRHVGFFKQERGTRFARLDTRVYSPLCATLAAGVLLVAAT